MEWLEAGTPEERALLVLSIVCAALIILTLLLVAAAFILRWRNTRTARHWNRVEVAWEELILEVLEGAREPATVLPRVPAEDVPLFVEYLSRFARRLRGAERDRIGRLAEPFLPAVALRLTAPDPAVRARAAQVLSLLALVPYADHLVAALDDPEPMVAMAAAGALARRDHPEFAPAILAHLHRFPHWDGRFLAAMLAAMGPVTAPALLEVLASGSRPLRVRTVSADALGMLSHLPAADTAGMILEQEVDRELIAAALRLLRQVGRREHVPAVRAQLEAPDDFVREHAITAFGALADPGELSALIPRLDDPSPWVRLAAARALRPLEEGRVLRALAAGGGPAGLVAQAALAEVAA